ncbi:unnamed protein product [Caenorhabditis bovis]|uniref:Uncharacterized protein n=1 Tax=Caenorhabditis bovis TaxID=2654633 RepID=A0A8S1EPU4_9PELO|nr:unnamed protein product [Caenorhabditis bovis]
MNTLSVVLLAVLAVFALAAPQRVIEKTTIIKTGGGPSFGRGPVGPPPRGFGPGPAPGFGRGPVGPFGRGPVGPIGRGPVGPIGRGPVGPISKTTIIKTTVVG